MVRVCYRIQKLFLKFRKVFQANYVLIVGNVRLEHVHQDRQRPRTLLLVVELILDYRLRDPVLVVDAPVEHKQRYTAAILLSYVVDQ